MLPSVRGPSSEPLPWAALDLYSFSSDPFLGGAHRGLEGSGDSAKVTPRVARLELGAPLQASRAVFQRRPLSGGAPAGGGRWAVVSVGSWRASHVLSEGRPRLSMCCAAP